MTEIYAIRHLKTPWNREGLLQGHTNISIEEIGQDLQTEIDSLIKAHGLDQTNFDKVFVSPLKRTKETAEAFGFRTVEVDPRLIEVSFGPFEGRKKSELIQATRGAWVTNPKATDLWPAVLDLELRMQEFLKDMTQHKRVLLFAHGAVLRYLRVHFEGMKLNQINEIRVENGEVLKFHVT